MEKALRDEIRRRASYRCEYCQFPEAASDFDHEIDHIVSQQHHGPTVSENLALCCGRCNLSKGPNIAGLDPETRVLTPLFNPRIDVWADHFYWQGAILVGQTAVGRTTVDVLSINSLLRVAIRQVLMDADKYFPTEKDSSR